MSIRISEFHGAAGSYASLETPARIFECRMLPGQTAREAIAAAATDFEVRAADLMRRAESLRFALESTK